MADISIPFRPDMIQAIRAGNKICTSRSKRYGSPGDVFSLDGKLYRLVSVHRFALYFVANFLYIEEGVSSPAEFVRLWEEIHPVAGYEPNKVVCTHFFEEVSG
jgi:hypothetical protein